MLRVPAIVLIVIFLCLPSLGRELFSVQLATFKTEERARKFLGELPLDLKLFLYRSGNFYTVREGLFQKRKDADRERRKLKRELGLNGIVVRVLPEKLLYLFRDENYEEFLGLFSELRPEELPPKVLYAIGISHLKLGDFKEAESFLAMSLKKGERDATSKLVELYYAEGKYKKVTSLYEAWGENLPDSALYYVIASYLNEKNWRKAKELAAKVKAENVRKRILRKRTFLKTDISYGYDSNAYLVPEDFPLERRSRSDRYVKFSLFFTGSDLFQSYSFRIYGKRFNNRHNSDLDIVILEFENENRLSGFNLVLPSVSYVYTMNRSYSVAVKSGIRKKFTPTYLSFFLGLERNFKSKGRNNFLAESFVSYKGFGLFFLYRNYWHMNDKVYVTINRELRLNSLGNLDISLTPKVKLAKYMASTTSVRPGITGKVSLRVKNGRAYLRGGYERNYAYDEELEWDYKRYFVELGIDFGF